MVFGVLVDICRARGVSALIATHNLQMAVKMDRTWLLHDGKLIEDAGYFWDHAEQRHKIAHDYLFASYVHPRGKHYPLDFRRFRKRDILANLAVRLAPGGLLVLGVNDVVDQVPSHRAVALREALLTRRNSEWAAELNRILGEETGVFFVAVGASNVTNVSAVPRRRAAPRWSASRERAPVC